MYKIIACDLDETLLRRSDSRVPLVNANAVKKLKEYDVKFVVATGRGYYNVQNTLEELGIKGSCFDYTISYNGSFVTRNDDTYIYELQFDYDLAQSIVNASIKYNVPVQIYTKYAMYIYNNDPEEYAYISKKIPDAKIIDSPDISFLKNDMLTKIVYVSTDHNYLVKISEELKDLCADCNITYSANRFMEINPKGTSKAQGLIRLCDYLHIDLKDTIAIGDNFNDLELFRTAGLAAGVSNIVPELISEVDFVSDKDCDEGGVADIIEKFIFNKK